MFVHHLFSQVFLNGIILQLQHSSPASYAHFAGTKLPTLGFLAKSPWIRL
jgi:hypothetical protein